MTNNVRSRTKVERVGFFRAHIRQAKASFWELWRRPLGNILTLAVIAMALSLPASVYLIGKNMAKVAQGVTSSSQINVYIKELTSEARIMVLKDQLESSNNVASVQYISSQQGLSDLSEFAGFEEAISLLSDYSLPAVLVIQPSSQSDSTIKQITESLQREDVVTDVRLDADWLVRLDAMQNLAGIVAITLMVLMLAAVFLIIGNTLRFTVLAHKEEIQVMKLIGATDSFILRPYLYSGVWFGFIGAVSAWILTTMITMLLNGAVETLALLYDSQFRLIGLNEDESLLLIMLGILLGFIAARLSARRHLKEIEPI